MDSRKQVWLCLLCNLLLTIATVIIVCIFRDAKSTYFRIGPHKDLMIISVCVNTWIKWTFVVFIIGLSKVCDVLINEVGTPILGFTVYNPDKKVITEFSKNELNFLANATFMVNGVRSILMMVINVTQVDLAMLGMLVSEIASIFTVRFLLSKKIFSPQDDPNKKPLLSSELV